MLLFIDNFDSFSYNIVQAVQKLGIEVKVLHNDALSVEQCILLKPQAVIIGPGPGRPENSGICLNLIRLLPSSTPLLGICLGMQALGYAYGAKVVRAPEVMHGKTSLCLHNGSDLFANCSNPFTCGRYHSLVIERKSLQDPLEEIAVTKEGVVMGIRHKNYPRYGVQFHPESVLSEQGDVIFRNFIEKSFLLNNASLPPRFLKAGRECRLEVLSHR